MTKPWLATSMTLAAMALLIAHVATQSNVFFTFDRHPEDAVILICLVVGAGPLAWLVLRWQSDGNVLQPAFFIFLYYFVTFSIFLDGYGAGWSHSTDVASKLGMAVIYLIILLVTGFVPLIFFALALVSWLLFRYWSKRWKNVLKVPDAGV